MNYRVRYWLNDEWCYSGIMTLKSARDIVNAGGWEMMSVVVDEDGFPEAIINA